MPCSYFGIDVESTYQDGIELHAVAQGTWLSWW